MIVQILLCQFHTISCLRRMMSGSKYFVRPGHRNEIENHINAMLYAPNKMRYCEARDAFKLRAKRSRNRI
jgi:hypothetical protein